MQTEVPQGTARGAVLSYPKLLLHTLQETGPLIGPKMSF